jgi:hypothetical protein
MSKSDTSHLEIAKVIAGFLHNEFWRRAQSLQVRVIAPT